MKMADYEKAREEIGLISIAQGNIERFTKMMETSEKVDTIKFTYQIGQETTNVYLPEGTLDRMLEMEIKHWEDNKTMHEKEFQKI